MIFTGKYGGSYSPIPREPMFFYGDISPYFIALYRRTIALYRRTLLRYIAVLLRYIAVLYCLTYLF